MGCFSNSAPPSPPPSPTTCLDDLPSHPLSNIFSFLPLTAQLQCSSVCSFWRETITSGHLPCVVDYGTLFAGLIPPNHEFLLSVARQISGRELSFSNCAWLTTGALLTVLGVPVGISSIAPLPAMKTSREDRFWSAAEREEKVGPLVDLMGGGGVAEGGGGAERFIRRHELLRTFLGEYTTSALRKLEYSVDGEFAEALGHPPPANAPPTPHTLASLHPWWWTIGPCVRDALTAPPSPLPPLQAARTQLARSIIGGMVLRERALFTCEQGLLTLQEVAEWEKKHHPRLTAHDDSSLSYAACVGAAYTEMGVALAALRTRRKALLAALAVSGGGGARGSAANDEQRSINAAGGEVPPPPPHTPHTLASSFPFAKSLHMSLCGSIFSAVQNMQANPAHASPSYLLEEGDGAAHYVSVAYGTVAADLCSFALQAGGRKVTSNFFPSFEIPSPMVGPFRTTAFNKFPATGSCFPPPARLLTAADAAQLGGTLLDSCDNLAGVQVPATYATPVTGLSLHGCTQLLSPNFPLLLSFTPLLSILNLGGCCQLDAASLCAAFSTLPKLKWLDLQYCSGVRDSVLAVLGSKCPLLTSLQLTGCTEISDAGMCGVAGVGVGAGGGGGGSSGSAPPSLPPLNCLLPSGRSSALKELNLRGCTGLGDATIRALSTRAPLLSDVCLSGLTTLTPPAIGALLLGCARLFRIKAELWFDGDGGGEAPDVQGDKGRTYRLTKGIRTCPPCVCPDRIRSKCSS